MPPESEPGVMVTLSEIYRLLLTMKGDLDAMTRERQGDRSDLADHESRIRNMERKIYAIPGFAVIVAVAALVVPFLNR